MPKLPPTATAWLVTLIGAALLLFSVVMHWQMVLVIFGIRHVAPGGGEYMVAFFAGLPALLLGSLLLGIATFMFRLRSILSIALFLLAITGILAWVIGIVVT